MEWWWNPLLEQLQAEGVCVQADSWSMAVDPNFLQTLHKDVIRQQDVIYGDLSDPPDPVTTPTNSSSADRPGDVVFCSLVSQSSSKQSSITCGRCESWRACTGAGCRKK